MKRTLAISLIGLLAALVAGAALWKYDQHQRSFYTDGSSIERSVSEAVGVIREVLWQPPVPLGGAVNSAGDETEPHITADGSALLFAGKGAAARSDLLISQRIDGSWAQPRSLIDINSDSNDRHPALSSDGRSLIFSSDRDGGMGGFDLWIAHQTDFGWGEPVNLGPEINSAADELGATFSPDGSMLVFASNRDGGDGMHSLYLARVSADGYSLAKLLDPLNSTGHDVSPAFSAAGDFLYFSSDRAGGRGGFDLYRARLLEGEFLAPQPLGDEVNTHANEIHPAPEGSGFAIIFSSDRVRSDAEAGHGFDLWRAESREVFVRVGPRGPLDFAGLSALLGPLLIWLLILLLTLLLLLLSWKGVRSNKLSLLARCVLASLIAHLMLMILLTFWQVTTQIAHLMDRGGTRVVLTTSASVNQLSQQLRGGMTSVEALSPRETDAASRATIELANDAPPTETAAISTAAASLPPEQRTNVEMRAIESQSKAVESPEASLQIAEAMASSPLREVAAPQDAHRETTTEAAAQQPREQVAQSSRSEQGQQEPVPASLMQMPARAFQPGMAPIESAQPMAVSADVQDASSTVAPAASGIVAATETVRIDPLAPNEVDLPPPAQGEAVRVAERDSPSAPVRSDASAPRTSGWTASDTFSPPQAEQIAMHAPIAEFTERDPSAISVPNLADAESDSATQADAPVSALQVDAATDQAIAITLTTPSESDAQTANDHEAAVPAPPRAIAASGEARSERSSNVAASDHSATPAVFAPAADVRASTPETESITIDSDLAPAESQQALPANAQAMIESSLLDDELASQLGIVALNIPLEGAAKTGDATRLVEAPVNIADPAAPAAALDATEAARSGASIVAHADSTGDAVMMLPDMLTSIPEDALPLNGPVERARESTAGSMQFDAPSSSVMLDDFDLPPVAAMPAGAAGAAVSLPDEAVAAGPDAVDPDDQAHDSATELVAKAPASERHQETINKAVQHDNTLIESNVESLASNESAVADSIPAFASPAMPETQQPAFAMSMAMIPAMAMTEFAAHGGSSMADINLRLPMEMSAPANPYAARAEATRLDTVKRMGGSEETERAVAMALEWLARHQSADGRWATRAFDIDCKGCAGEGKFDTDIATTGLALLCFLGADYTHLKDSKYQSNVIRALQWLIEQQQPDGDLRGGETMYSHGIAAIALAEAYGMTADARLREPVRRAVAFIDAARNTTVGGWRYEPQQAGDTSVAGWQVMALMSAKRAGLETPDAAFASASAWMDAVSVVNRPGRYAYQPGQPPSPSMTAEGFFIQQLLGVPRDDARMQGSVEYILEYLPRWDDAASTYYWYYATLAMFQHQGPEWERWNKELTRVLLANQRRSGPAAGSWDPKDNWAQIGGRIYQTALCTLSLEVYYRYLPMYRSPTLAGAPSAVRGTVTDASTGLPLAGATVKIDLSTGAGALIAATDADGRYALALPELPADFVAMSASLDGYVPATTNIERREAEAVGVIRDFALERVRSNIIALEDDPQVHHLGNDAFEGAINSQFQKSTEGSTYRAAFMLTQQHLPPNVRTAELLMMVKGAQAQNTIFINNQRLGTRLNGSPRDGSFGEFRTEIPLRLLREGENIITIRASTSMGDLDDFEFTNIQIRFDGGVEGAANDTER